MYSLECDYYTAKFQSLNDLIENVKMSGMDPSYEITYDGVGIGENAEDFLVG
jgi:hypothetical protein